MAHSPDGEPDFADSGPVEYRPAESVPRSTIERVLANESSRLLAIPGVTSVGIAFGPPGRDAIAVGIIDRGVASRVPTEIEGVPVVVEVTGIVDALPKR
ncbi:MAG: hypothetical protein HEQ38_03030 [Gemmatimonas sp.]|jgi:hypothetical protein|nr:hypothetical protein [Gemmatimonas sp.]